MKRCPRCDTEKDLDCFHNDKSRKDGKRVWCKECRSKEPQNQSRKKQWYQDNRDITLERSKKRQTENKEEIDIYKRGWYQNNKEKLKERSREHYYKNWIDIRNKLSQDEYKEKAKRWRNKNRHVMAWRSVLQRALRTINSEFTGKCADLLGYTAKDLKNHIEILWTPGMNWNNYGDWHLDHIRPVSSYNKDTDPSVVHALSNLRPLWSTTREIDGIVYEGNLNREKKWIDPN